MCRQHVHFVDEVDLESPPRRTVLHVLQQLAGVIHLGARGGVHLDQIDEAAFINFCARGALATGHGRHTLFAIQALGKDAGNGGLADAARTGEQERMMQAIFIQRVDQGTLYMLLTDQLREQARSPSAREDHITHIGCFNQVIKPGPYFNIRGKKEAARTRHTSTPGGTATVAPFRAWRGSRITVARGPTRTARAALYRLWMKRQGTDPAAESFGAWDGPDKHCLCRLRPSALLQRHVTGNGILHADLLQD